MPKAAPWCWTVLLAALAVGLGAAAGYGCRWVLDRELVGYRGVKEFQFEQARKRDLRRRAIPGVPAVRERVLREEFGDLPETIDLRTEARLVNLWERLLTAEFGVAAVAAALYVIFRRGKAPARRVATAAAALVACSQALPQLLLPDDALRLVRQIGNPFLAAAAAYLIYEIVRSRLTAPRVVPENDE